MSSPSLTGVSPNNPTKYLGPNVSQSSIVIRNREPTGADVKQPNTGKYYPFGTLWLVGETSPGVPPTTGSRGDLWYLSFIAASVAFWTPMVDISNPAIETLTGDDGVAVGPDANQNVNVIANVVANATHAKPVYVVNNAANTETIHVQLATAVAPTPVDVNSCGIACFNSDQFQVDATSGMVSSLLTSSESTFTPVLSFGGSTTGITYSNAIGNYTLIGNTLFFNLFLQLSSKGTATGVAEVSGLPFPCAVQTIDSILNMTVVNIPANTFQTIGTLSLGTSTISLLYEITGSPISGGSIDDTFFADTSMLRLFGFYYIA